MNPKSYDKKINELEEKILSLEKKQSFKERLKKTAIVAVAFLTPALVYSQLIKPHTFTAGNVISAAEMNANFDAIIADINRIDGLLALDGTMTLVDGNGATIGSIIDFPTAVPLVYNQQRYFFDVKKDTGKIVSTIYYTGFNCDGTPYSHGPPGKVVSDISNAKWYIPKNATTISVTTQSYDDWGLCLGGSYTHSVYPITANDPAVTGVPNTFVLPLSVQ